MTSSPISTAEHEGGHGGPAQSAGVLPAQRLRVAIAEEWLVADPWRIPRESVQPASVDLRLGDSFRVFHNPRASAIDLRHPPENLTEEVVIPSDDPFVIHPG